MKALARSLVVRPAEPPEAAQWDELVRQFEGCRVVHKRAWLEWLEESMPGRALYLVCEKDGEIAACWPGMLFRWGPLRAFGSPLPGSQTTIMGPVFDSKRISARELVSAAVAFLEKRFGVNYIELIASALPEDQMRELGFDGPRLKTHVLPLLPGREEEVFQGFKPSARRNIRRAAKLKLQARFEDDESFVDEVYAQIQDVFRRGRAAVPFGKERVGAFFRRMKAANNLVAASVSLPDGGPCIATGLFTIEGRELLLWQWAHRSEYRWYRPTEFMTWTVMQKAMAAGCDTFDLMGGNDFKKKFGAREDFSRHRWMRSRYTWMRRGRRWAETCYRWQQAWRQRIARLAARNRRETSAPPETPNRQ